MTELEIAKLALDMIAHPLLNGASRVNVLDHKYLKNIAEIALVEMIKVRYDDKSVLFKI